MSSIYEYFFNTITQSIMEKGIRVKVVCRIFGPNASGYVSIFNINVLGRNSRRYHNLIK
jgi:hypothetical protein